MYMRPFFPPVPPDVPPDVKKQAIDEGQAKLCDIPNVDPLECCSEDRSRSEAQQPQGPCHERPDIKESILELDGNCFVQQCPHFIDNLYSCNYDNLPDCVHNQESKASLVRRKFLVMK